MELRQAIRRRRMVRAFQHRPVPPGTVDALIDLARRAPSAGNTQPWAFVVLDQPDQTAALWDLTLPAERRASFRWQGLLDAPVVILPLVSADAYLARYSEADKAAAGLTRAEAWTVPYWWVDGGMAVHALLLSAVDAGLGALFYALFEHEGPLLEQLGVPPGWRALGAIALGWPAPHELGRSAQRPRPPLADVIRRGRW